MKELFDFNKFIAGLGIKTKEGDVIYYLKSCKNTDGVYVVKEDGKQILITLEELSNQFYRYVRPELGEWIMVWHSNKPSMNANLRNYIGLNTNKICVVSPCRQFTKQDVYERMMPLKVWKNVHQ